MALTIQLEIPDGDELVAALLAKPEAERSRYALALLRAGRVFVASEDATSDSERTSTSPEDLASIGEGLADSDAGHVADADTFFVYLRHELGLDSTRARTDG